ncbi:MAG: hypothetical protein JXA24_04805 [Proteobacteria bacterium]|nr:hypothetical protein [Pseudomonadota bacterium]
MARTEFETPVIFGVLCDGRPAAPRGMERRIRARIPEAVLLPFQVEPRHLKNVLRCMRLMDVEGLIVAGGHRRRMARHITSLDSSARAAALVDVIARSARGFRGYCAEEIVRSRDSYKQYKTNLRRKGRSSDKVRQRTAEVTVELLTAHRQFK